MFSATHDLETMSRAHSAGACSYLAKNSISTNLDAALLMIHSGNMVYSKPADAQRFPVSSVNSYDLQAQFLRQTNPRGRRLLNALANGYTNSEIATMLHVSEGTVKAQLAKIMEPLNVKNRVQLAVLVAQAGLLEEARPTLPLTSGPARYATPRAYFGISKTTAWIYNCLLGSSPIGEEPNKHSRLALKRQPTILKVDERPELDRIFRCRFTDDQ